MSIHAIPGHFPLPRIKTNQNLVHFSIHLAICMTICVAYAIRPYAGTRKNDDYFISRIKTNRNPDEFLPGRVGAYCIRPTDGHSGGRTNRKIAIFQVARVGAYCIRPTNGHARGRMNPIPIRFLIHRIKTNQKPAQFLSVRVGAYCIRLTNSHASGRTDRKIAIF